MGYQNQPQQVPGHQSAMEPVPDCGEHSYVGRGRLEGKATIVIGGRPIL